MNECLEAAIKYATKYHWAVFPVSPQTKKPLTPHGCKDAKKSVGPIRAWWKKWPTASVGIATGSISGLIVIDEDLDEDKGLDGVAEVSIWERAHGELPETARVITGRGGSHLYYSYAGDDIKNRTGVLEGVDVRGEGGYVVAPPSIHPNGTEYVWEDDPEDVGITPLDDHVRSFLAIGEEEKRQENEFKLPTQIQPGERNDSLFRLACSLQAQGLPDAAILAAVNKTNQENCVEPLSDKEVEIIVSSALRYNKGELKVVSAGMEEWHEPKIAFVIDKDGEVTDRPAQTIANAEEAIAFDKELYGRLRLNEIAYAPYVFGNLPWKTHKGWREWTDADDSNLRSYVENKYGIKLAAKVTDAFTNVVSRHPINPIKGMLETCLEQWDGNKYVENLLPMMLGAEKNEYNTAVMRLTMRGAVARIYSPGCKFDYMPVLVGEQGGGKSTFLRMLAMSDDWFHDNFSTLDSTRAIENLRGMWFVELAELQATKRTKDVEAIKAFVTSRRDTIRVPYGRRTEQRRRMCILCGTSNPTDFLTDRTGNRRFLPVMCNINPPTFDMFADEVATKAIFAQAWGEIMDEYTRAGGRVSLVLPKRLQTDALDMQTAFQEEDPKIGIIQEWLDGTEERRVCVMMLWREALEQKFDPGPQPQVVNSLHDIMKNNIKGWKYVGRQRCGKYGVQRCYERITDFRDVPVEKSPFD